MTKRDPSWDVVKAVAMLLVVFLHVRAYAPVPDAYRTPPAIENFCMASALPLFLMMSGLFSRRLFRELSVRRLALRVFACLWPVATMIGIAGILVRTVIGLPPLPPGGLIAYLLSAGWFFFCLAFCEIMTFAAIFLSRSGTWRLPFLLTVGYFVLWALPFGMFHAVEMLPFYWFGVFALPHLREGRRSAIVGVFSLLVFLAICCLSDDFRQCGLNFHLTSMGLLAFDGRGLFLMAGRILLGLLGGFGLITVLRLAVARFPALGCLAGFGRQTMGVFFVHLLLLLPYYTCHGWWGGGVVGRLALAVAFFVLSHCIVVLSRRNRIVNAVLWNPMLAKEGGA